MLKRFASWDWAAKLALGLCLLGPLFTFFFSGAFLTEDAGSTADSQWWQWLLLPVGIVVMVPFVGSPQIAMLSLIRMTDRIAFKLIFLAASIVLIGAVFRFAQTADLTSNSTAPLAILFYPFEIAVIAFAIGGALVWYVKRSSRRQDEN